MKKIIIVGNSSYARMMHKYIMLTEFGQVCAYVVDAEYINQTELDNVEVISFEEMQEKYSTDEVVLIMGIGYTQMSNVRKNVFEKCRGYGYRFANYIHPTAIISPDVILGEGNNILEGVIIEVGVTIGNANLFFGGSVIGHESEIGSYNTFSVSSTIAGCVEVRNNCFLGASSAVRDHVVINDYVLLGATAYGYKNIPEYSVVVPAKSEILKDKKSFDYL